MKEKADALEEASHLEIEVTQAKFSAQKNELDLLEAKVTTRVRAKLMYQFMMNRTASWEP